MASHPATPSVTTEPQLIELEPSTYLAIDGQGPPGSKRFHASIDALFRVATALQASRWPEGHEIEGLETLWWAEGDRPMRKAPADTWRWRHLVQIPVAPEEDILEEARVAARQNGAHRDLLAAVHLERMGGGIALQCLHHGPYDRVGSVYDELLEIMEDKGLCQAGPIHELYLNSPDEVDEADLETICRLPVRPA